MNDVMDENKLLVFALLMMLSLVKCVLVTSQTFLCLVPFVTNGADNGRERDVRRLYMSAYVYFVHSAFTTN